MTLIPWKERAPQTGGTSDLDELWTELREWPGYYVTSIIPGSSSGSRGFDDEWVPDRGWHKAYSPSSWCVEVEQDGWEPRDRWLAWGATIADASAELARRMRRQRENPHLGHIVDCILVRGCVECAWENDEYFDSHGEIVDPKPGLYSMPSSNTGAVTP